MSVDTVPPVPEHVPSELVRHVDVIGDPTVTADPYGVFDRLGAEGPVLYSSALGGFWLVLGEAEVREAFQRTDVFSSYPTGVPPMAGFWPRKLIPQELDGDEHRRYRKLLIPFFGPAAIRPIVRSVEERAAELIAGFADAERIDFVESFAKPLPTTVFLTLFGLPVERADAFTTWSSDLLHAADPRVSAESGRNIVGYLAELIARRRRSPDGDDLISALVQARVDGEPLTDDELLDTCFLLFIAGLDTVTSQLSVIFHHLATHPDQQRALRRDPDSVPAVLEELLRTYPIVPPARTLTRDHELGGVRMKAGDTVLIGVSGATRSRVGGDDGSGDDGSGDDASRADRSRAASLAFGLGPHRCLGVHLARHELEITMRLMCTQAPPFSLAPGAGPRMRTAGNVWGLDSLPLVFGDA
ncbi:MAG TPA: cytochrome P450 [Actinomycetospora sp.]|uniref:cytochrome P450 n=1 Tax=Actinomycetospora sp. TaxID=1872135 RepID=UPI002F406A06